VFALFGVFLVGDAALTTTEPTRLALFQRAVSLAGIDPDSPLFTGLWPSQRYRN